MFLEAVVFATLTLVGIATIAWWVLRLMGHKLENLWNANPPFHS
jgi:hypothetical protein